MGESGVPCYSWQGERLGCHSQSAGQGWGQLFCVFQLEVFCLAMPPLPSSVGLRESRLCWGSVSVSTVISGWQASFDSESGIYEMKTNLRELTTALFLASPARLPFLHLEWDGHRKDFRQESQSPSAKVGLGASLTSWGPGSAVNILSHCGVEGRPGILHPQDSLPLHPATILLLRTASCVGDWTHTTHSGLSSVPLPKRLLSKTSFPVSGATLLPGSFSA